MLIAAAAGIRVFATIGGVHRGAEVNFPDLGVCQNWDRSDVAVILCFVEGYFEHSETLEYLETLWRASDWLSL